MCTTDTGGATLARHGTLLCLSLLLDPAVAADVGCLWPFSPKSIDTIMPLEMDSISIFASSFPTVTQKGNVSHKSAFTNGG